MLQLPSMELISHSSQSQSQSQCYFTTGSLPPINSSWRQAPWDPRSEFLFSTEYSPYVTPSLRRGRVWSLQLLLGLASTVILRSDSRGTHEHILLPQIRDSPNLEGHVLVFISPRNRVARLYPQAQGSLFVASNDRQGCLRSSLYSLGAAPTANAAFFFGACRFAAAQICLPYRCLATRAVQTTALQLLPALSSTVTCLPSCCLAMNYSCSQASCHNTNGCKRCLK
jgi:hypothetical protein